MTADKFDFDFHHEVNMGCLLGTDFLLCWVNGEEVHLIKKHNLILLKYSHQRSFVSVFFQAQNKYITYDS